MDPWWLMDRLLIWAPLEVWSTPSTPAKAIDTTPASSKDIWRWAKTCDADILEQGMHVHEQKLFSCECRLQGLNTTIWEKCEVSRASGKTGHECHPNEEKGKSFAQSVKVFGLRIGGGLFLGRKSCCIWQILSLSKNSSCTKSLYKNIYIYIWV